MADKVFYSWQSDSPNNTNKNFILTALGKAIKEIADDGDLEVEPVVDRDTQGVAGSPDISASIFAKIDEASVFVCDVSIIEAKVQRPSPNPNVLVELGYAVKVLGWGRIVMVMNTFYGGPELLPFDLRGKRVSTYSINSDTETKAPERKKLQKTLTLALKTIYQNESQLQGTPKLTQQADIISIDKALFRKFQEVLPSNGSIQFIAQFNMAGFSFSNTDLDDLWRFNHRWNDAEHEFIDGELERSRANLYYLIDDYLLFIALNTFPVSGSNDDQIVPPEWEVNEPARFYSVVKKLHDLAGQIFETHQQLIRDARTKLAV